MRKNSCCTSWGSGVLSWVPLGETLNSFREVCVADFLGVSAINGRVNVRKPKIEPNKICSTQGSAECQGLKADEVKLYYKERYNTMKGLNKVFIPRSGRRPEETGAERESIDVGVVHLFMQWHQCPYSCMSSPCSHSSLYSYYSSKNERSSVRRVYEQRFRIYYYNTSTRKYENASTRNLERRTNAVVRHVHIPKIKVSTYLISLAWIILSFFRLLLSHFSLEEDIMQLDAIIAVTTDLILVTSYST